MVANDLVCENINVCSLDLLMPSVMKKHAGNDEDGRQQFRKWNKKTNLFYFDVTWESIDDHGHGYIVDPVGKLKIIQVKSPEFVLL